MRDAGRLVFAALPFGFGPASKALTLAQRLRGRAHRTFVGVGTALDLVRRAPATFDEVVEARATDPAARGLVEEAAAVVSFMDRDAGHAARDANRPLIVVDSLLWMRPAVPEALAHAAAYLAQAFPGLSPGAYEPRPLVVGPLVAPRSAAPDARGDHVVVHLGGSGAPDGRGDLYAAYADLVLRAVAAAGLPAAHPRVVLIGGTSVLAAVSARAGAVGVEVAAPGPQEARDLMARARLVLTAPGWTTTLECLRDGTPTFFLPPQNYSQWCILRALRAAGAAPGSLHWEDLPGVPALPERRPPSEVDPVVVSTVRRCAGDEDVARRLAEALRDDRPGSPARVARQRRFAEALGPDGWDEVVARVEEVLAVGTRPSRSVFWEDPSWT